MLRNTFCHMPRIGEKSEQWLWGSGLLSWDDCYGVVTAPLTRDAREWIRECVRESDAQLRHGNSRYFARRLPSTEHWRLFPEFRRSVAYLDIETNGFHGTRGYVTTIAIYDGKSIFHYVQGRNLDEFADDIRNYKLIVTYNGKCFDLPFIKASMGLGLDIPHIDLRYVLKGLGYTGGLKGCEKQLGVDRKELEGVDGYCAILLWNDFIRNDNHRALETLIAYNIQDVLSLEYLMVAAYNLKLRRTPFEECRRLAVPVPPEIPFQADVQTVQRLRHRRCW